MWLRPVEQEVVSGLTEDLQKMNTNEDSPSPECKAKTGRGPLCISNSRGSTSYFRGAFIFALLDSSITLFPRGGWVFKSHPCISYSATLASQINTGRDTHTCTHTSPNTHTCTRVLTYTWTHLHALISQIYSNTYIHACNHMYVHVLKYMYNHVHTNM